MKPIKLQHTVISFPEIRLKTRDAHKLRGYFGNIFKEHSPLLHNHFEDGSDRYAYPLVQYKVIQNVPVLMGLAEGARLLTALFLKIKEIDLDGINYPINSKNITSQMHEFGVLEELTKYHFETLWMALNQKNFKQYSEIPDNESKSKFLNRQLQNNILSFYKGIGFRTSDRIMVTGSYHEKSTKFKDNMMLAFRGEFVTNAFLPDYIGIGKAVSRGFGTVIRTNKN